ncbi:MAG: nucleotidyl transferase AbiEii/AbiGii toxin family protein [Bacteroidetes bacterium]|nr:nucleotidyl transferase AbiEii/AbiGii toxin family protein [Bacteroidota bacterium]MCL2303487.1 nucleotidyl transferase AbiEii/AbiGii toxin family protein [Lentimicrobiaceae bacterium]
MDLNKHKYVMLQILRDIYSDLELANSLGFKGGTALMLFYELPRFSVDLDFNLLKLGKENDVYQKIRTILLKYGKIDDEAQKFFGPILVLNYGRGERKLKVEISNRQDSSHYEVKTFMGINMLVMTVADMLANKLCALLDRNELTNRDIFDCWFFMEKATPVNKNLVESRMKMTFTDYLQKCIDTLNNLSDKGLLNGVGDLLEDKMKNFVRTKLRSETILLLNFYKEFPIE